MNSENGGDGHKFICAVSILLKTDAKKVIL